MYRIIGADGREYGPVSAEQMRQWISEGRIHRQTWTRAEGSREWQPAGAQVEFSFSLLPPQFPATPAAESVGRKTNSMATAGMILGVLALTFGLCCYGLPFNIIGLIFSIIGLMQIRSHPEIYEGQGTAIAGIILCLLSILLTVGMGLIVGLLSVFGDSRVHSFRI